MKKDPYQGWTNAATWCAAGFLNNTKVSQDTALAACRLPKSRAVTVLKQLIVNHFKEIYNFAAWVWERGESISDINVDELVEHFQDKIREGA